MQVLGPSSCTVGRMTYSPLEGHAHTRESDPFSALRMSRHKWPGTSQAGLQGYLAHKKPPTPLGPPKGPRHKSTVGC
jgi:hypothetical protein